jgi:class 3 adenylate cyclase
VEPQIQYAKTSDGVSIAYWTMGQGGLPLIMSPPLAWSHISQELRVPELAAWYERLASTRMLIRYDQRNQGLSDRGVERVSSADLASDIEALIERLGASQVDLLGFFGSGTPMLRVAAEHETAVRRLVLWDPIIGGAAFFANARWGAMRGLIESDWVLFTETFSASAFGWTGDEAHQWARFARRAVGPLDAGLLVDAIASNDWSEWLAQTRVPTLVLRGRGDTGTEPRWSDIPNGRLVHLRERASPHRNEAGQRAIEEFLSDGEQTPAVTTPSHRSAAATAIILFADIADSTALTEQLGDAAFRAKARELDEALRRAISANGGTAIDGKLLGDGVLATFGAAREAIACSAAIHDAGSHTGLPLHVGIHAGDVIREDDNVYGGAVNIAARVASEAAAGETLVSATVRDLARTSAGVSFEDRGERDLKGIGEPVRVFAVRSA